MEIAIMTSARDESKAEFGYEIRLDEIDRRDRSLTLNASEAERAALARRFGVAAIASLAAMLTVRRISAGVYCATGDIEAEVSVNPASGEAALDFTVSDRFEEMFASPDGWRALEEARCDGEVDAELVTDGVIDLGEVVAQNLSLALDPMFLEAGALETGDVVFSAGAKETDYDDSPFAALTTLRGRSPSPDDPSRG